MLCSDMQGERCLFKHHLANRSPSHFELHRASFSNGPGLHSCSMGSRVYVGDEEYEWFCW